MCKISLAFWKAHKIFLPISNLLVSHRCTEVIGNVNLVPKQDILIVVGARNIAVHFQEYSKRIEPLLEMPS